MDRLLDGDVHGVGVRDGHLDVLGHGHRDGVGHGDTDLLHHRHVVRLRVLGVRVAFGFPLVGGAGGGERRQEEDSCCLL